MMFLRTFKIAQRKKKGGSQVPKKDKGSYRSRMRTSKEIEKKYLVKIIPDGINDCQKIDIVQGYFWEKCNGEEIRIRRQKDLKTKRTKYFLTVKNGKGMVREEAEVYLNKKTFEHYWGKTENKRVSKLRHIINMHGLKVAIDFYRGNLSGLIIAEIEFKTESEAKNFNSFSWLGKDVTEDEDFKNNNLACYGLPEKFSLHNKKQP
ncbi:MAG TPA: hypothetical protein PLA41_01490 [Candidatus Pacearchaeota archaeon]|nr:hypothetical protein [Candidatus Pacearchaeota archaeon]HPM08632.1 hypothetical protein [Candidatus Pacearchaeota archaeon]HQI74532.1 hypothetical protein [Candidatus Pacearchaeota archaeon]